MGQLGGPRWHFLCLSWARSGLVLFGVWPCGPKVSSPLCSCTVDWGCIALLFLLFDWIMLYPPDWLSSSLLLRRGCCFVFVFTFFRAVCVVSAFSSNCLGDTLKYWNGQVVFPSPGGFQAHKYPPPIHTWRLWFSLSALDWGAWVLHALLLFLWPCAGTHTALCCVACVASVVNHGEGT